MRHNTEKEATQTPIDWADFSFRYFELNSLVRVLHLALLHQSQTGFTNRGNEDSLASVAGFIDKQMGELSEVFEPLV